MTIWEGLGWLASAGFLVALAGSLLWLLWRRSSAAESTDESWEFSLENYGSMNRLLAEEDLLFLRAQRGHRPEMDIRWRQERYRLFRLYLSELKLDFRRLHAKARALVAQSDAESADLVGVLMRQDSDVSVGAGGLGIPAPAVPHRSGRHPHCAVPRVNRGDAAGSGRAYGCARGIAGLRL